MKSRSRRTSGGRRPGPLAAGPWKHGPIPVIGVVGGIGSGKSAVAAGFGALGGFVIDADTVGHALLNQRHVLDEVVARFGPRVLGADADGTPQVDRRVLGSIVFEDRKALADLEAILHPRMRETFVRAIARVVRRGRASAVVLDAAVLFEAGWDALCDRVVFVDAPRDQRLARLGASRNWTDAMLQAREAAQWPLDDKKARADVVVANAADLEALSGEVARAWESVCRPAVPRPKAAGTAEARTGLRDG